MTVGGVPATSAESVSSFVTWATAQTSWPYFTPLADGANVSSEDTTQERLAWHEAEADQLNKVLALADDIALLNRKLKEFRVRSVTWSDRQDVILTSRMIDAALADHERVEIERKLTALTLGLVPVARIENPAECGLELLNAIENRADEQYRYAYQGFIQVLAVRDRMNRRDVLASKLSQAAPALLEYLITSP